MNYKGLYGKRGRPPKDWKPTICLHLQVKRGKFIIIFDHDIAGDFRSLFNMPKLPIMVHFD